MYVLNNNNCYNNYLVTDTVILIFFKKYSVTVIAYNISVVQEEKPSIFLPCQNVNFDKDRNESTEIKPE